MSVNADFPRTLSLLRKERGCSQKAAAEALGISQALLSHYEKGIREPGLEFLCRAAGYYGVSCDYLLGRSADKTGVRITVEELPESDPFSRAQTPGGILPLLNKKLLVNSLQIFYDLLGRTGCKGLVNELSAFLMLSLYRAFRVVYGVNPKNQRSFFSVPDALADGAADAAATAAITRARALAACQPLPDEPAPDPEKAPAVSSDSLAADYPQFATSLLNLVKNAESCAAGKPARG